MATVFLGYRRIVYDRLSASWKKQQLVSIMQNQHSSYSMSWRKNTDESCQLKVWLFSWQCTTAQIIGCSASCPRLWICSTEPSCLQSRLGSQWLFPNKKSEVSSSWDLVYRLRIIDDRCRGMVWESKQKILFSGHKQLRRKVEKVHWCYRRICRNMTVYTI